MSTQKSPTIALLLSLVMPGLGQLYTGDRMKSLVILCMDAGIGGGVALATLGPVALRSKLTVILLGVAYLFIWIPAAIDAYQQAAGAVKPLLSGERTWYVIFMLLTIGPGAIPFLWQSPRFSKPAKVVWTAVVALIALGFLLSALLVGPAVEQSFQQLREILTTPP